jgi:transcriptional regulator with XRE-family HTH domain
MAKGKWNADYFAKRIRTEREQRGWTQEQLAEQMSSKNGPPMHWTIVAKIESGTRAVRINEAAVFADVFDTSVDALLGRKAQRGDDADYALTAAIDTARRSSMELTGIQNVLTERFGELEGLDTEGLDQLRAVAESVSTALRFAAEGLARIAFYRQVGAVPPGDTDTHEAWRELIRDTAMQSAKKGKR